MPAHVVYPKVSLEKASGRIARWIVAEGQAVKRGQVLFEIEDDKAAVEVEAPADGIIGQMIAEDFEVTVGDPVALIFAPGETPTTAPQDAKPPVAKSGGETQPAIIARQTGRTGRGPNPTPLARRLASEHGLDLSGIPGTGPRGRVQKTDVLAQVARGESRAARPSAAAAPGGELLNAVWLRRGQGKPYVLLHGFAADLNNWRGLLAAARLDHPVLALDLPAHGGSTRSIPADLDALAAMVEATMAAQFEGPALLAGHSLGGAVATRIAARGLADVRALALFAPGGLGPEINAAFIDGIARSREAASLKPWLLELVADPAVITPTFLRVAVESRRDAGLTEALRAFALRFFPDGTQSFSIRADLARLTIPTRVIFGRGDRILPFAATRGLPGNVALHVLDNCGHMPHLEHPEFSARILAELMRSA
jgi:pyruvate dehydrogenase E2 component (dihydrolipoamide acetyltransferase)